MTTQEHLNRIKAKCQELLAIAEKRTAGEWTVNRHPTEVIDATSILSEDGQEICCGLKWHDDWMGNGSFIASCAGAAEAGWRLTISMIDLTEWNDEEGATSSAIIAAWPQELL